MDLMEPERLLHELDETAKAIMTSEAFLATLKARADSIADILEAMTRPAQIPPAVMPAETRRGFFYRGRFYECHTCVGIWRRMLKTLWADFPERQEAMASALASAGYNRSYVAKDRDRLFLFKSRHWTMKFSEEFAPGWFLDSNVTPERIRRILPLAVAAAGLDTKNDFSIHWE